MGKLLGLLDWIVWTFADDVWCLQAKPDTCLLPGQTQVILVGHCLFVFFALSKAGENWKKVDPCVCVQPRKTLSVCQFFCFHGIALLLTYPSFNWLGSYACQARITLTYLMSPWFIHPLDVTLVCEDDLPTQGQTELLQGHEACTKWLQ